MKMASAVRYYYKKVFICISGTLKITASGVILRGSGMGNNGTVILASGLRPNWSNQDVRAAQSKGESEVPITDKYVPVNATQVTVSNASNFQGWRPDD
jgi:hypothetical protein